MKAIDFPERNVLLGATQDQYSTLPVAYDANAEGGPMTACFQLDADELKEIAETGILWFTQWTFNNPFQPVLMTTKKQEDLKYCPMFSKISDIIKTLQQIDRNLPEGKLLFAALTVLTTKIYTNNTPDEVINTLHQMVIDMNY